VAAATQRNQQVVRTGEIDAVNHVGYLGTPRNQGWAPVDHAIKDFAGRIVAVLTRA
jgi:hypothetical protein